jgi:hypothetical protein
MAAEDHREKFPAVDGKPPLQVLGPYGRRIDEVQLAIEDQIMPALAGNELGVVLFEGDAKDQVDLDDNFQKIRWEFANNWLGIGQAPGDGSDYGKGLAMALTVFKNSNTPGKNKVIVLFSDGGSDNLDRKALAKTVEKIKAEHVKVIVVAVGSEREMKVNSYNAQGVATGYVKLEGCEDKDSDGNCQTRLDMKELSGLAAKFNTQPLVLDVGAKLPIEWAKQIAGSKAVNRPDHLYRFFSCAQYLFGEATPTDSKPVDFVRLSLACISLSATLHAGWRTLVGSTSERKQRHVTQNLFRKAQESARRARQSRYRLRS